MLAAASVTLSLSSASSSVLVAGCFLWFLLIPGHTVQSLAKTAVQAHIKAPCIRSTVQPTTTATGTH